MARIDGLNPLDTSRTQQGTGIQEAPGSAARAREAEQGSRSADAAQVSARGRLVAEAARAVRSGDDIRHDRVAALKAAIADGTYRVDAAAIARRLVASGLDGQ